MRRTRSRIAELVGIFAIGDGALSVAAPRRHVSLWRGGPPPWRRFMRALGRRPTLTRAIGAAELLVGVLLVSSALRRKS